MYRKCAIALLLAGFVAVPSAMADPPPWAGGGKGKHERKKEKHQGSNSSHHDGHERRGHFSEHHHVIVREYYGDEFRRGKCPPGLAKKNNGCMPPGQAKKWHVGQPLPREVVYYEVPRPLVIKLPPPAPGHRYVRVAADILLIAIGTGMVIDAVHDLGKVL